MATSHSRNPGSRSSRYRKPAKNTTVSMSTRNGAIDSRTSCAQARRSATGIAFKVFWYPVGHRNDFSRVKATVVRQSGLVDCGKVGNSDGPAERIVWCRSAITSNTWLRIKQPRHSRNTPRCGSGRDSSSARRIRRVAIHGAALALSRMEHGRCSMKGIFLTAGGCSHSPEGWMPPSPHLTHIGPNEYLVALEVA